MDCREFLTRFSDYYDAPPQSRLRREAEEHLEHCEKCARYEQTVASGAALLQTLPRIEPSERFRPTLEHRLFHLEDENVLARAAGASAVPAITAVGIAIIFAVVAWSPTLKRSTVQVHLAPIVVSGPPSQAPDFPALTGRFIRRDPASGLAKDLWADPNALLYEYSPMRERYEAEEPLRQAGFNSQD